MSGNFDPDEVLRRLESEEYLPRSEKIAQLSDHARAAADWIVERNLEIVAHSLRVAPPEEAPCALCLMPMYFSELEPLEKRLGREIDPLHVDVVCVDTHAARRRSDPDGDPIVEAWLGIDWADVRYPNLREPGFLDREDVVVPEALRLIGGMPSGDEFDWDYDWLWGWIFERVARRLNSAPPLAVTADFVAYFQDMNFCPWPPEIVRHLGRPSAVALLEEQGLLPDA